MRIVNIEAFAISFPIPPDKSVTLGIGRAVKRDAVLVKVTTASGLAIAIPLVFCTAAINVRIRRMEDLVAAGLTQFFERFRRALGLAESQGGK